MSPRSLELLCLLPVLPGIVAVGLALTGAGNAAITGFCQAYWWMIFVAGALLSGVLRVWLRLAMRV